MRPLVEQIIASQLFLVAPVEVVSAQVCHGAGRLQIVSYIWRIWNMCKPGPGCQDLSNCRNPRKEEKTLVD